MGPAFSLPGGLFRNQQVKAWWGSLQPVRTLSLNLQAEN